ncbi:unnamed protein product [Peronospora effusa]|nr:unnamed protein product [Peronospora effusa]
MRLATRTKNRQPKRCSSPSQEYTPFHSLVPFFPALPAQTQQVRARAPADVPAQMPATAEEHAAGAYGATHAAARPPGYLRQHMYVGTPDSRQRNLTESKFDGSELYRGLGSGLY